MPKRGNFLIIIPDTPQCNGNYFTIFTGKKWTGEQMHDTIILMKDLQELCVKGTKLSLTQLANILKICHNVTKLDFSYQHHEGLLKALLENPLSNPSHLSDLSHMSYMSHLSPLFRPFMFTVFQYCRLSCLSLSCEYKSNPPSFHEFASPKKFMYNIINNFTTIADCC